MMTNETLTDEQIEDLRTDVCAAGDAKQVDLCDRALYDGDEAARAECLRVINEAELNAMDTLNEDTDQ